MQFFFEKTLIKAVLRDELHIGNLNQVTTCRFRFLSRGRLSKKFQSFCQFFFSGGKKKFFLALPEQYEYLALLAFLRRSHFFEITGQKAVFEHFFYKFLAKKTLFFDALSPSKLADLGDKGFFRKY